MTINLVDGRAGERHISGDDLGDFKAGFIGSAGYVLKTGDMLAATMASANSVTVGTGSAVLPGSGRHVRVTAPETLVVESGTQGQKRNDVVVLRPSTSTDNTVAESCSLVVVKGAATSGTAADPALQDDDLPLYRLSLDGVSVADPVPLFDMLTPYAEFRDSISQDTSRALKRSLASLDCDLATYSGVWAFSGGVYTKDVSDDFASISFAMAQIATAPTNYAIVGVSPSKREVKIHARRTSSNAAANEALNVKLLVLGTFK